MPPASRLVRRSSQQVQVEREVLRRLDATARFLFQAAPNDLRDGRGEFIWQWQWLVVQDGAGDTDHFPGLAGKWSMARALVRGDLQALRLAPRMLRKRPQIDRLRSLSPREVRRLILAHRLPLREVA